MAGNVRNDADQTVAAAQRTQESIQNFKQACQQFANLTAAGTGLEGAAQTAFANSGQRVLESGTRFESMATPRVDAIRESATQTANVGDEGSNALNSIDVNF